MKLTDHAAERVLLGGLLRWPDEMFPRLNAMQFAPDCVTLPVHRFCFDEIKEVWVTFEPVTLIGLHRALKRPVLVGTVLRTQAEELGQPVGQWVAGIWFAVTDYWPRNPNEMYDRQKWIEPEDDTAPELCILALAAARKLKYLAARRHAIFRAQEVLKRAETGDDPDLLNQEL